MSENTWGQWKISVCGPYPDPSSPSFCLASFASALSRAACIPKDPVATCRRLSCRARPLCLHPPKYGLSFFLSSLLPLHTKCGRYRGLSSIYVSFFIFWQSDKTLEGGGRDREGGGGWETAWVLARVLAAFWINLMPDDGRSGWWRLCDVTAKENIIIQKFHSKTWRFHFGTRSSRSPSTTSPSAHARGWSIQDFCSGFSLPRPFHNHNSIWF